jgi:hypothetical protein
MTGNSCDRVVQTTNGAWIWTNIFFMLFQAWSNGGFAVQLAHDERSVL